MAIILRQDKGSALTFEELDDNFRAVAPKTSDTGQLIMPAGTSAQRDPDPVLGSLRYNTSLNVLEIYTVGTWAPVISGGSGVDAVIGGNLNVGGDFLVESNAEFDLGLTVNTDRVVIDSNGNTTIEGTLDVTGATTLSTLEVTGDSTFTGQISASTFDTTDSSAITFIPEVVTNSNLTVESSLVVGQDLDVTGTAEISNIVAGRTTVNGSFRVNGSGVITGDLVLGGDITIGGNTNTGDADTDSITIRADIASNLIPDITDTYDLGTNTKRWKEGFFDVNVSINDYVFPTSDGTLNQIIKTNGSGQLFFDDMDTFGGNRVYVSAAKGNDANDGITAPVASVKRAAQIASELAYQPTTLDATIELETAALRNAKESIADDTITYINTTYPTLIYDTAKCRRDVQEIIDSAIYDLRFGGNSRSVTAGEYYYDGTGTLYITGQVSETIDAINYAKSLAITYLTGTRATAIGASFDIVTSIITDIANAPAKVYGNYTTTQITIMVASGDYIEQNPILLGDDISIVGDNLRRVILRPANPNIDMFRVRNSSYMTGIVFRDGLSAGVPDYTFRYAISFDNVADTSTSRAGYINLPVARPKIFTSPYIQNSSVISFLGGNGVEIDGNLIDTPNTPPNNIEAENPVSLVDGIPEQGKSMVANAFTILSFGGNAWRVINDAYAQIVSCFVIFTENGCLTQNGGYLSITNSASNFGLFALRSTGYSPNSFEFDRGWIYGNGIFDGTQTLKVANFKRPPLEHFVLRIRNPSNTDITDTYNNDGTFGYTASISGSQLTSINSSTITFASAHNFSNGDVVAYDANGNTEIVGLLNECEYFVSVGSSTEITLFHDEDREKPVRALDGSVSSGTHNFKKGYEQFFINEIVSTHNEYQDIFVTQGSYSYSIGQVIEGLNGSSVISAVIVDYESLADVPNLRDRFTVSIELVQEGSNQVRNKFAPGSSIIAGEIAGGAVSVAAVQDRGDLYSTEFTIKSTIGSNTLGAIASTSLQQAYLHRPSICNSSAHTWEYAGSGTDYNALPQNGGQTYQFFQQVSTLPGRVYTSGTNELGDFLVGDFVKAFNRTGNIEFVNQVSIGELDTLALSLSSGVTVNEISIDIELGDNEVGGPSHSRLVTQLAARSFLDNRLGAFIDQNLSSNSIPNAVVQLNSQGQINSDLIPPQSNFTSYRVNGYNSRLQLHEDIPVNDLKAGDIVIEQYDQIALTLSGTVTVGVNETITQANTGATGVLKQAVSGSNQIYLIEQFSGTFSTNVADTLSASVTGALGVYPTIVAGPDEVNDNYFITTSRDTQYLILDPTGSYVFTNLIAAQTKLKGATSGAVCTIQSYTTGVLTAVDIVNDVPGGSGYSLPGTYTDVTLTNISGSGVGAKADITIAGGQVTSFDLKRGGSGYTTSDVLSFNDASVGGRIGGSAFEIDVTDVENRLDIVLDQTAGLEFGSTTSNIDFIIDDNAVTQNIGNAAATLTQTFDAADIGTGGDVDYSTSRITILSHGRLDGDPVVYSSGANVVIGNTTNFQTYFVKRIDANTIELYTDYVLTPINKVNFSSSSTGNHSLTVQNVNVDINKFYYFGHGYSTGDALKVTGSNLPTGLDDQGFYFVGGVTTNSFTLHEGRGSALDSVNGLIVSAVDITTTGTGAINFQKQNVFIIGDANTSGQDEANWSSLSNVTIDADNIISGIIDTSRLGTGSANNNTFLRGDSTFAVAVQGIKNTVDTDPITLTSANSYTDVASETVHYGVVDIKVELASLGGASATGSETLGVAAFFYDHFTIDANGLVKVRGTAQGGTVDADTVDGIEASQFLRSDANDSASGVISLTNNTSSTSSGTGALVVTGGVGIGENLHVQGNLTVNGTTTTVNSTTVTIDDPIFTLGGDTAPASDDGLDRGIEYRWYDAGALTPGARVGFFGVDQSATTFTFIPNATNSSEVFSGDPGPAVFSELTADTLQSLTTNGNLELIANGTGVVEVNDTLQVDGITNITTGGLNVDNISSYSANTPLTLTGDGTGRVIISDTAEITGTLYLENQDSLAFEDGKHWITYNDAQGNFNIRIGHKSNSSVQEEATEAGFIFHDEWSQSSGWRQFNISSVTMAVGNYIGQDISSPADGVSDFNWHTQIYYDANQVQLSYQGNVKLETYTDGIEVQNSITSRTANTNLTLSANGTGVVEIDDTLQVDGITNITTGGLNVDSISSYTADTNLSLSADGDGVVVINDRTDITTGGLNVDSISSYTANTNLTLSADGTGVVEINDNAQINGTLFFNTTTNAAISFEGTNDNFETSLSFTDPTADRTIVVPNADGVLVLDQDIARSLGAVPAYGSATEDNVQWDATQQAIKLYSSTDNSIGLAFPAFEVNALGTQSLTPIRISIAIKGDVASTTGLYLRIQELDAALTAGKTHVSNGAGTSSSLVQEDTRQISTWTENAAVPTNWTTYTFNYTPTDTAQWASIIVLNWTGHGTNAIWVQPPQINQDIGDNPFFETIKLEAPVSTYGQNTILRSGDNAYLSNLVFTLPSESSGTLVHYDSNGRVKIEDDGNNQPSITLKNNYPDTFPPGDGAEFIIERTDINGGGGNIGNVKWRTTNENDIMADYIKIAGNQVDHTASTEDADLRFWVMRAGSLTNMLSINDFESQCITLESDTRLRWRGPSSSTNFVELYPTNGLTANRVIIIPDAAGTMALTSDIPGSNDSPTFNGLTLSSQTQGNPILRIENTNNDAVGPEINIGKTTTNEGDGDDLGAINFFGKSSNNLEYAFAKIEATAIDVSSTSHDGQLDFQVMSDNVMGDTRFTIRGQGTSALEDAAINLPDNAPFNFTSQTGGYVMNIKRTFRDQPNNGAVLALQLEEDTGPEDDPWIDFINYSAATGDNAVDPSQNIFGSIGTISSAQGIHIWGHENVKLTAGTTQDMPSYVTNAGGGIRIEPSNIYFYSSVLGPGNGLNPDNGISIGSSTDRFNTIWATTFNGEATSALYADLAEKYLVDEKYENGTVIAVGGSAEVTAADTDNAHSVIGVVSTAPGFIMNEGLEDGIAIALKGRVPVKIVGSVKQGDRLAPSNVKGYAEANNDRNAWSFAIALHDSNNNTVEAVIL